VPDNVDSLGGKDGVALPGVRKVFAKQINVNGGPCRVLCVFVDLQDVACYQTVFFPLWEVTDDKYEVKARQKWNRKVDVLRDVFVGIVLAVHRVCRSEYRGSSVERCDNPAFCNGACLLLHHLVER